ncbi:MAG: NRDE family protein [Halieaceae bacterium]|jgi:uncharacterized protein with NRDE domain|nr:NRDE family protein [Halieaceae bacterium]
MCLISFAWQMRRDLPLLVAANRDEFHARPTAAAHFWPDADAVFAGRDLSAGGTWLGMGPGGRFAAITNIRDPDSTTSGRRSRGELTLDFLRGRSAAETYLDALAGRIASYQGFNLIIGDGDSLWYLHGVAGSLPQRLGPGIYGLSNAALDVPWPKLCRARERLQDLVAMPEAPTAEALLACVSDRSLAPREELAKFGDTMLRELSAQFIVTERYGTRSQTSLRNFADGRREFMEVRFDSAGRESGRSAVCTLG